MAVEKRGFLAFERGLTSLPTVFSAFRLIPSWWPAGHQDGRVSQSVHHWGAAGGVLHEQTDRLFLCARCQAQVQVCSQCDGGQRYPPIPR